MICRKCGELLRDNARTCRICHARQDAAPKVSVQPKRLNPQHVHYDDCTKGHGGRKSQTVYRKTGTSYRHTGMDFKKALGLFFSRGMDFRGRSTRSEFWWAMPFVILATVLLMVMELYAPWLLAVVIPGIALGVRRLHDIGKPGLLMLLALIPMFGWMILLILFCAPSGPNNKWGREP